MEADLDLQLFVFSVKKAEIRGVFYQSQRYQDAIEEEEVIHHQNETFSNNYNQLFNPQYNALLIPSLHTSDSLVTVQNFNSEEHLKTISEKTEMDTSSDPVFKVALQPTAHHKIEANSIIKPVEIICNTLTSTNISNKPVHNPNKQLTLNIPSNPAPGILRKPPPNLPSKQTHNFNKQNHQIKPSLQVPPPAPQKRQAFRSMPPPSKVSKTATTNQSHTPGFTNIAKKPDAPHQKCASPVPLLQLGRQKSFQSDTKSSRSRSNTRKPTHNVAQYQGHLSKKNEKISPSITKSKCTACKCRETNRLFGEKRRAKSSSPTGKGNSNNSNKPHLTWAKEDNLVNAMPPKNVCMKSQSDHGSARKSSSNKTLEKSSYEVLKLAKQVMKNIDNLSLSDSRHHLAFKCCDQDPEAKLSKIEILVPSEPESSSPPTLDVHHSPTRQPIKKLSNVITQTDLIEYPNKPFKKPSVSSSIELLDKQIRKDIVLSRLCQQNMPIVSINRPLVLQQVLNLDIKSGTKSNNNKPCNLGYAEYICKNVEEEEKSVETTPINVTKSTEVRMSLVDQNRPFNVCSQSSQSQWEPVLENVFTFNIPPEPLRCHRQVDKSVDCCPNRQRPKTPPGCPCSQVQIKCRCMQDKKLLTVSPARSISDAAMRSEPYRDEESVIRKYNLSPSRSLSRSRDHFRKASTSPSITRSPVSFAMDESPSATPQGNCCERKFFKKFWKKNKKEQQRSPQIMLSDNLAVLSVEPSEGRPKRNVPPGASDRGPKKNIPPGASKPKAQTGKNDYVLVHDVSLQASVLDTRKDEHDYYKNYKDEKFHKAINRSLSKAELMKLAEKYPSKKDLSDSMKANRSKSEAAMRKQKDSSMRAYEDRKKDARDQMKDSRSRTEADWRKQKDSSTRAYEDRKKDARGQIKDSRSRTEADWRKQKDSSTRAYEDRKKDARGQMKDSRSRTEADWRKQKDSSTRANEDKKKDARGQMKGSRSRTEADRNKQKQKSSEDFKKAKPKGSDHRQQSQHSYDKKKKDTSDSMKSSKSKSDAQLRREREKRNEDTRKGKTHASDHQKQGTSCYNKKKKDAHDSKSKSETHVRKPAGKSSEDMRKGRDQKKKDVSDSRSRTDTQRKKQMDKKSEDQKKAKAHSSDRQKQEASCYNKKKKEQSDSLKASKSKSDAQLRKEKEKKNEEAKKARAAADKRKKDASDKLKSSSSKANEDAKRGKAAASSEYQKQQAQAKASHDKARKDASDSMKDRQGKAKAHFSKQLGKSNVYYSTAQRDFDESLNFETLFLGKDVNPCYDRSKRTEEHEFYDYSDTETSPGRRPEYLSGSEITSTSSVESQPIRDIISSSSEGEINCKCSVSIGELHDCSGKVSCDELEWIQVVGKASRNRERMAGNRRHNLRKIKESYFGTRKLD